jgi:uncharacterized protein
MKSPSINAILSSFIYWLLFLGLLFFAGILANGIISPAWNRFIWGIAGTISAFIVAWLILRVEKKSFAHYGLTWQKGTLLRFFKGFLLGTAIILIIILGLLLFTEIQIEINPESWNSIALISYSSIIPLALMEEIAFRSYPFVKLNTVFGLRVTQVLVAIAFASYHIISGWDIQIAFLGPGLWAFVFGLAVVWSKGIALPTGIHVAINLGQVLGGMRNQGQESIWILRYPENTSQESIEFTNTVGLASQVLVFVITVFLMELYIRRKSKD